jgi:membrane-associated protease RseP (regulator of RpoE activity)
MIKHTILLFALASYGLHAGEALHSRGWIGGEYALAKKTFFQREQDVPAFPTELRHQQKAGVFVRSVPTNSPAAQAGLQVGDLILRVNDQKTESLGTFRKLIEQSKPGAPLQLTVWKEGESRTVQVTTGRETYRKVGTLGVGFHFSSKVDLVPNPDFSAFVLGFDHSDERVELHSPESEFISEVREQNGHKNDSGQTSREGWKLWLVILQLGMHKTILNQEAVL